MKNKEKIYQSILSHLSLVPTDYLLQVDNYLQNLSKEIKRKEQNRQLILKLAGSWADMEETEFNDFLATTKKIGSEMFVKHIDL